MPLNHLCSPSTNKIGAFSVKNTAPFLPISIHPKNFHDVKLKHQMERCDSSASTLSFNKDICRICHCEGDIDLPLIAPCFCAGSLRFVHQTCLQQWIKSSNTKSCELCKFLFIMQTKVKPFRKWEKLDMTRTERCKIIFSVTFHAIAITCVAWSLFVLIQRTSQEAMNGELEWAFWTKLIVVAIGFTGSVVFMYVQCKMYIHLCKRWRAFNRVIYVQNAPEKVPLSEIEHNKLKKDSARSSPFHSNEVDKHLLSVAVILSTHSGDGVLMPHPSPPPPATLSTVMSNTNTTTHIPSGGGGATVCCTTSNTPPGALWADDPPPVSPHLSTFSYFNSGLPNHKRGSLKPSDTLLPNGDSSKLPKTTRTTLYSDSPRRFKKDEESELSRSILENRIIHTPNNSSFRSFAEDGSDGSDLETLHLDTQ